MTPTHADTPALEQDARRPRLPRALRLALIGGGIGLALTAGTMLMDQFTASASAATMPVAPEPAAVSVVAASDVLAPALMSEADDMMLAVARDEADALVAASEEIGADAESRGQLAALIDRADDLRGRIAAGTATAEDVAALEQLVADIRAAMDTVGASVAQESQAGYGDDYGYGYGGDDGTGYEAEYGDGGGGGGGDGWSMASDGYCDDPSCAQAAVDSSDLAYVDYGTGYRAYSGHNYGPAGVIADMAAGDYVEVDGTGYTITDSQIVGQDATTNDVRDGLALQTCLDDGTMVIHYIQ